MIDKKSLNPVLTQYEPHLICASAGQTVHAVVVFYSSRAPKGGVTGHTSKSCVALHLDSCSPHDCKPQEYVNNWNGESVVDELFDCTAFGDLSDKHANEWRPGDPPTPVEDTPVSHSSIQVPLFRQERCEFVGRRLCGNQSG